MGLQCSRQLCAEKVRVQDPVQRRFHTAAAICLQYFCSINLAALAHACVGFLGHMHGPHEGFELYNRAPQLHADLHSTEFPISECRSQITKPLIYVPALPRSEWQKQCLSKFRSSVLRASGKLPAGKGLSKLGILPPQSRVSHIMGHLLHWLAKG